MRHLKSGRRLGRNASHRLAMFRNLAMALFQHERIITTVAKAKEARPFVEKLITLAKKNTLHARRLILAQLGTPSKALVDPTKDRDKLTNPYIIEKLFKEIAPRYSDRPGGYTRVLKRSQRRLGDAGQTAFLELVVPGDRPRRKKSVSSSPAPVLAPSKTTPVKNIESASPPNEGSAKE